MDVRHLLKSRGCLHEFPRPPLQLPHHFIGAGRKHLGGYCNVDPILSDVTILWRFTRQFASMFGEGGDRQPEVVVAPAIGAIPLAHLTAIQLTHQFPMSHVDAVWGEKVYGPDGRLKRFVLNRGFGQVVRGKRVLVVEDMINQGWTIGLLIDAIRQAGGVVVGVGAIAYNTGVSAASLDVPLFAGLCEFGYPVMSEDDCVRSGWCAVDVPIVLDEALGHGLDYQRLHPELPAERFVRLRAV